MKRVLILNTTGALVVAGGLLAVVARRDNSPPQQPPPADLVEDRKWDAFALLLIDVQNDFWAPQVAAQYPDFPEHVAQLLEICRSEGIDIIHVRSEFEPDMADWPLSYKQRFSRRMPCVRGTKGAEVTRFAAEQPGETIFYKATFDAFLNPELGRYLEQENKKHLLIAGMTIDVCLLSTIFGAFDRGYLLSLVEDCCAGPPSAHDFVVRYYDGFLFDSVRVREIPSQYSKWTSARQAL